jgi:hypothetical protein
MNYMRAYVSRDRDQSVEVRQTKWVELRRHGAHRTRNAQPVCAIGKSQRQMQHEAAHGAFNPYAELEQAIAQGADLSAYTLAAEGYQTQLPHQYVSGGSQHHTQLIGQEARAAGSVHF